MVLCGVVRQGRLGKALSGRFRYGKAGLVS